MEWMLQMFQPRSWSFVRTLLPNPDPHVLVVLVAGCEYTMLHTEQVITLNSEHEAEMLFTSHKDEWEGDSSLAPSLLSSKTSPDNTR